MLQKLTKHLNVKRIGLVVPHDTKLTYRGYGLKIRPSEVVHAVITRGKEAGAIEDLKLPANKYVALDFGPISPIKMNVQLAVNPELFEVADIQAPTMFDPDEESQVVIFLKTNQAVDLREFDYLVKLYLVD